MFGLQIASLDMEYIADLTATSRVFDVSMSVLTIVDGVYTSDIKVKLQQCTKEHWKMIPSLGQNESFEGYGVSNWLCPQVNSLLPIKGQYTSKEQVLMKIELYECKNSTSNDTCASKEEIDSIFDTYENFYFTFYYVNPVINANVPNHLSYYLEGDDYTIFSRKTGCEQIFLVSDYTIKTDQSIFPLESTKEEKGFIMLSKSEKNLYSVN